MEKSVSFIIKDVTFNYPNLGTPITPTFMDGDASPQWSIKVEGIKEDVAMDLKEAGAPVSLEDDQFVMNLKQYVVTMKGKKNKLNVFGPDGELMTKAKADKVGQGSKGHIAGFMYTYNNESGTGTAVRFTDVQVTELVEKTPETPEERRARLFG